MHAQNHALTLSLESQKGWIIKLFQYAENFLFLTMWKLTTPWCCSRTCWIPMYWIPSIKPLHYTRVYWTRSCLVDGFTKAISWNTYFLFTYTILYHFFLNLCLSRLKFLEPYCDLRLWYYSMFWSKLRKDVMDGLTHLLLKLCEIAFNFPWWSSEYLLTFK